MALEWETQKKICIMVNIYSPCDRNSKIRLWEKVLSLRIDWIVNLWCVKGDFSSIIGKGERKGNNTLVGDEEDSKAFNNFIKVLCLIHLYLIEYV